jgi:drug/metabolite transporter (DMT)-like permease
MNLTVLSLLIAFAGYSVQNISQASQKIGFLKMKEDKKKGMIIWGAATVGTGLSTLILLAAVSIGQVSLVGAMAGTGLISMTLYSMFIMKEKPGKNEIIGVCLILISAVFIGIFSDDAHKSVIVLNLLVIKLIAVSLIYGFLWTLFRKKKKVLCVVLGGFAGALGGFVSQFQKISTSASLDGQLITESVSGIDSLLNPFTLFWILLSITSMTVLQFAHKNGQPMQVIPSFSANFILIPVIGGVTCFGEVLHPVQWMAVGVIIIGVLMITIKKEEPVTLSN